MDDSKWVGGPRRSTACGDLAVGLERWGMLECGVGSAEGWCRGDGVGMEIALCGTPFRHWWPMVIHRINLRTTDFMK